MKFNMLTVSMGLGTHAVQGLVVTSLMFATVSSQAKRDGDVSASEIVRRADEGRLPPGQIVFTATVKDLVNGDMKRETRYEVTNDPERNSGLIKTSFPERQRGRKLLMEGDNLWLYTPDTKRPARVSMQQRLTGELSNGDLARTYFNTDYKSEVVGTESVKGDDAYLLKLTAKRSGVTYSKIDYWVRKKDFLPLKAVYYAVSGKKLKTAIYSDPKTVLGRKCITKMHFSDAIDSSKQSTLVYSKHREVMLTKLALSKESFGD